MNDENARTTITEPVATSPEIPAQVPRNQPLGERPYYDPAAAASAQPTTVLPIVRTRRRRRSTLFRALAFVIPLLLVTGGASAWFLRPQTDAHYLAALRVAHLTSEYPSSTAAVAHAKGFCRQLAEGHDLQGYDGEKVGVQFYCDKYLPGFKVVPTPQQLQDKYLTAMRDGGFGGTFASDAAAVAHAQSFCEGLKTGAKQQGMPVDLVGVNSYCPEFSSGFHVLQTATVKGTFTLIDSSVYYNSIDSYDGGCDGSGGYSDIHSGTSVTIKNGEGKLLAETSLGSGTGGSYRCTFPFSVDLTEGEDTYVVTISHRGDVNYTFDRLQTDGIDLTLGS